VIARLYRLTLCAFPKRHRDLYRAEMIDAFERELERRRGNGLLAGTRFALAAFADLIAAGIAERRRHHVVRFGYVFSALDFTLAWRMLIRYPGLSVVAVFGIAVGIAIAAGAFAVISAIVEVRLPLPEGERVVSVIETSASLSGHEWRMLHDFASWRSAASLTDLGFNHQVTRNLMVEGRTPEPVAVAEISPSAFRVARVEALRGRYLLDDDARADADDVIVIGYDEWVRRFDADPNIVGHTVRLGGTTHTIVGVMPEGFGFPVNHTFWIPWRIDPGVYQPLTGPSVTVFGRLAPGATLETANAELVGFGRRAAADSPRTHQHLRPLVIPYTYAYNDMGDPENQLTLRAIQASLTMLLILVCINVSILVYARTATRQGEITVRGALGASRRRIVAQLFVEALVLAGVAAAIGVFMISIAMPLLEAQKNSIIGRTMPFWMHLQISTDVVTDIVLLTLLAATIVGVVPALKATGVNVQARLQTLSGGGGSRMQMGPLWTLLIVAQVAATVTVLPAAIFFTWESLRVRSDGAGFDSREVLGASLTLERSSAPATASGDTAFRLRFATQHAQLDDALRANPAVVDVTFSMESPGRERAMALEAEDQALPQEPVDYNITEGSKAGHLARYNRVATNFFDAFGIPLLLGRGFTRADLGTDHVIINRTLANVIFGAASPLGRRIKYVGRSRESVSDAMPLDRWFEIIGVVPDFPADEFVPDPILYHPAAHGDVLPARIGIRTRGSDPATYSNTVRDIAASVNPDLQLRDMTTTDMAAQQELGMFRIIGVTVGLVMISVIILSAAGIYALMSFTVAKRRREIGIRAALGADRNRLLVGIFSRAFRQLAIGAAIGMVGAFGVEQLLEGELFHGQGAIILPVVALVMIVVGVLASIGPARQGLGIHPIEALREE
jgi:putative ABC transport system permease protein